MSADFLNSYYFVTNIIGLLSNVATVVLLAVIVSKVTKK
jgi:hypothetical protein